MIHCGSDYENDIKRNIFIITRNITFAQDLILWPPTNDHSTLTHDLNSSRTAPDLTTCYINITPHAFTELQRCAVWKQTFLIFFLRLVQCSPLRTSPSNTVLLQSFQSPATVRELLTPFISGPLQPHQSFYSAVFLFSSFLHSGSHNFFWHSSDIQPFHMPISSYFKWFYKFHNAYPLPPYLFFFSSFLLLLWDH